MAALAYRILQCALVSEHGRASLISTALGTDWKGKLSPVLYLAAIGLAFVHEWLATPSTCPSPPCGSSPTAGSPA
jgi:hypothetical protein